MPDIPSEPRSFPRDTVAVVEPKASFALIVSTDRPTENCILIEAAARTDHRDLLRVTLSREDARHLARDILDETSPHPAHDEPPATDSAASLYAGIETRDAFAALTERVALLEKIAGVRWAKAATGKTDATAVDLYDWAFGLNEQTMAVETDCGTYLHERTMGRIARADGKPAIEKTIKTDTIYAAITFPTDDAYVRVGLRTGWNPQE